MSNFIDDFMCKLAKFCRAKSKSSKRCGNHKNSKVLPSDPQKNFENQNDLMKNSDGLNITNLRKLDTLDQIIDISPPEADQAPGADMPLNIRIAYFRKKIKEKDCTRECYFDQRL